MPAPWPGRVLLGHERDVAFQEQQPAVLGGGWRVIEQASRALPPAVADREVAAKVDVIGAEPHRHARRARHIPGLTIEAIGFLTRREEQVRLIE